MARTVPLHVRISPEAAATLRAVAEDERRPFASLLAIILEDAAFRAPAPAKTLLHEQGTDAAR